MNKKLERSLWLVGIAAAGLVFGCGKSPSSAAKPQAPAKVENAVKEAELTTVKLTEKAEARLGIETKPVEIKRIPGTLVVGGEVVALPGQYAPARATPAGPRELLRARAASQKDVEDAEVELARAQGSLEAAKGRLSLF